MATNAPLTDIPGVSSTPAAPVKHGFFFNLMHKVESLFHSAPTWIEGVNGVLQFGIPVVQTVIDLDAPGLSLVVDPVLSQVKVGMATLALMAEQGGSHPTLLSTLQSVQANVKQLETVAHVNDPATQTKISANLNLLVSELANVEQMLQPKTPSQP